MMAVKIKRIALGSRCCPDNDTDVFFSDSVDFFAKVDII